MADWHPILVTEQTPGVLEVWFEHRLVGRIPANALGSLLRACHEHKQRTKNRRTKK